MEEASPRRLLLLGQHGQKRNSRERPQRPRRRRRNLCQVRAGDEDEEDNGEDDSDGYEDDRMRFAMTDVGDSSSSWRALRGGGGSGR